MSLKNTLTNENLNKRFDNPFALVNYAISLAKVKIARGEGIDSNPVIEVLEMIAEHRDHFERNESEEREFEEESEEE